MVYGCTLVVDSVKAAFHSKVKFKNKADVKQVVSE